MATGSGFTPTRRRSPDSRVFSTRARASRRASCSPHVPTFGGKDTRRKRRRRGPVTRKPAWGPSWPPLGDGRHELGGVWRIGAASLLGLATASALGLALPVLGFVEPAGQTVSLWYVLLLSGLIGTACALVPAAPSASS